MSSLIPDSLPNRFWLFPAMLWGSLFLLAGLAIYLGGVLLAFTMAVLRMESAGILAWLSRQMLWYSGVPVVLGLAFTAIDLFVFLPRKRRNAGVSYLPPRNPQVTVALTAYNDEASIAHAVIDFKSHPLVRRVLVIDNNSSDATAEVARQAGALVICERHPGYGYCVHRALSEASSYTDTELILLCEGDMTFRAYDIDKFMAYIVHAEIVNGTRIVEQLRERETQLTTFMYYGNFFVGKLLEIKHLGQGTFTDVGTTYKLCRREVLPRLLPLLDPRVNLEFNAHFLDMALMQRCLIVECPITFSRRLGESKGGNLNNLRALKVGVRMIIGMLLGWRLIADR